jgi:hypothetical protein
MRLTSRLVITSWCNVRIVFRRIRHTKSPDLRAPARGSTIQGRGSAVAAAAFDRSDHQSNRTLDCCGEQQRERGVSSRQTGFEWMEAARWERRHLRCCEKMASSKLDQSEIVGQCWFLGRTVDGQCGRWAPVQPVSDVVPATADGVGCWLMGSLAPPSPKLDVQILAGGPRTEPRWKKP